MQIQLTREELLTLMRDLPESHWLQSRLTKELTNKGELRHYVRPRTEDEYWRAVREGRTP